MYNLGAMQWHAWVYSHGHKCVLPIKIKYLSNQLRFRVISTDRQAIEQRGMRCPFFVMYQPNLYV